MNYLKFWLVNIITFSRVIGSIVLPIVYFSCGVESLAIFVILLFLTDFIDGKLSRYWKVESFLGCFLDGISDKLFAFVMLAILSYEYPLMLVVILMEFAIFGINMIAFNENKNIQSSRTGKAKAFILDVVVSLLFIYNSANFIKDLIPRVYNFLINTEQSTSYILIGVLIGLELLTISDYKKNRFSQTEYIPLRGKKLKKFNKIWDILIDREFYIKNKNERLKDFLYE